MFWQSVLDNYSPFILNCLQHRTSYGTPSTTNNPPTTTLPKTSSTQYHCVCNRYRTSAITDQNCPSSNSGNTNHSSRHQCWFMSRLDWIRLYVLASSCCWVLSSEAAVANNNDTYVSYFAQLWCPHFVSKSMAGYAQSCHPRYSCLR